MMTAEEEYNNDELFETAPLEHVLRPIDRMRRTNPWSASSFDWFPVADFDVGLKAEYFRTGGFQVQKRKDTEEQA